MPRKNVYAYHAPVGSPVWETAMHQVCRGVPVLVMWLASWLSTHWLLRWSYNTTGSPRPRFLQSSSPGAAAHKVPKEVGPSRELPLLSQTAKDDPAPFTVWTKWFGPTAPLVSGGRAPVDMPS